MTVVVLMTCYNHEDYVTEAIESLQSQTFSDWTLIVTDDCSSDQSATRIKNYAKLDERITLVQNTENKGKSNSLNQQLPLVTAEFIAFLDSDDYWLPDKLEKQLAVFQDNSEVGVVYSDGVLVDSRAVSDRPKDKAWPEDIDGRLFSSIHKRPKQPSGDVFQELIDGNFIFYSSVMIRSKSINGAQFPVSIKRSIDWLFFIELADNSRFTYLPEPTAAYRIHGLNLQNTVFGSEQSVRTLRFLLEGYGSFMSRTVRAKHLRAIGNHYRHNKKYARSIKYFICSLCYHPFNRLTWGYLIDSVSFGKLGLKNFRRIIQRAELTRSNLNHQRF